VFHAGCLACGGPDGVVMVRTDVKASAEVSVVLGLFTVLLRIRLAGIQTGASRTPATGSRSGSDPVAASEEEQPLHVVHSSKIGLLRNPRPLHRCATTLTAPALGASGRPKGCSHGHPGDCLLTNQLRRNRQLERRVIAVGRRPNGGNRSAPD
jgi:hypothetical protein